jgi:antitoxin HicB
MLQYAAKLTPGLPEEGGYTVTFRDVPEAITDGETLEDALKYAAEALELALEHYLDERRQSPIPTASTEGRIPHRIAREPLAQVRSAQ